MALTGLASIHSYVVTALGGGTVGTPAVGVYVGADLAARIPLELMHDNTTVLLFSAVGVERSRLELGAPQFKSLRLAVLGSSPVSNVVLSGGFWRLQSENVRLKIVSADGAELQPAKMLWATPQTGQRDWHASVALETGGDRPIYVFEKVPADETLAVAG